MKLNITNLFSLLILGLWLSACSQSGYNEESNNSTKEITNKSAENYNPNYSERFADLRILQYDVPGFENLTLKQKKLAYYLSQATLAGRDIYYDQGFKHNIRIRKTLDAIIKNYNGDKNSDDWKKFMVYAKRFYFSNGIHHHYSEAKFLPECPKDFFAKLIKDSPAKELPLMKGMKQAKYANWMTEMLYDPNVAAKRVNKAQGADLIATSAGNYYEGVTQLEVEDFYAKMKEAMGQDNAPLYGLNSKLIKVTGEVKTAYRFADGTSNRKPNKGEIVELVWCIGSENHPSGLPGMYSEVLTEVVSWLEKAQTVAENDKQKEGFAKLIEFYKTGNLKTWDDYNIAWVEDTTGDIDYINGFIEVYKDPIGFRGYYEGVVQMTDKQASRIIKTISDDAQWFEDNSPLIDEHKKKEVKGISAKVVTVLMEGGASAPSTPIGINLPNSNWIRKVHGSKSVSLGNIVNGYNAAGSSGSLQEFAYNKEEIDRAKAHGVLADNLHTDMHEVIGHASGQINPGIGTPKETLKNYASTLEEARADLVALYYLMDQKLIDIGVMATLDVGKESYDGYIRNGLMLQLRRLDLGEDIEEDHMRNRQLVAGWAYEKGKKDNVIEKKTKDGKTYFIVNDYMKLKDLFGQLLREIQRIKSEGDFNAGRDLVENYGVKVDQKIHKEVLDRYAKLDVAPYSGFMQPKYTAVMKGDEIIDVKVECVGGFLDQMLEFNGKYGFLSLDSNPTM